MNTPNERWCLFVRSRIDPHETAIDRLNEFLGRLREVPPPWGITREYLPNSKTLVRDGFGVVGITRTMGSGIYKAMLSFNPRTNLTDSRNSDDVLMIDFNPQKVSMDILCHNAIPKFIEILNAYSVECFDEQFVELAYQTPLAERIQVDERWQVQSVFNICYYDEVLCKRAFGLTLKEVIARVEGKVEYVSELLGGVYIVGKQSAISFDESRSISDTLTQTLLSR